MHKFNKGNKLNNTNEYILNENLRPKDLEYLVSNFVSIDQYTSKLDDDNITIALFCNEREVAEELKDFIEKVYYIEIRDIEISDSLTDDNKYILFVEMERNVTFPKMLLDIIDSINYLTNNKKWTFKTFGNDNDIELNLDNLKKYVRLSKMRDNNIIDDKENVEEVEESYKPIVLNDNGWKRNYIPERYISEEEMNEYIVSSKSLNNRDIYEVSLLENAFPNCQIITTDEKIFVINKNKILMLS